MNEKEDSVTLKKLQDSVCNDSLVAVQNTIAECSDECIRSIRVGTIGLFIIRSEDGISIDCITIEPPIPDYEDGSHYYED